MKKLLFIICFLCTNILHTMEHENVDEQNAETFLNDQCKAHLKDVLTRYKTDNFTPQDMDNILEVLFFINARKDSEEYFHQVKDDQDNGMFQYGLDKVDLPGVQWMIEKGNIKYHSSKDCNDFVIFCTKQLSLDVEESTRKTAYDIVKMVVKYYEKNEKFELCREVFVRDMIILQLQHKMRGSQFAIDEQILTPFLTQDQTLAHLYQTIQDDTGDTLAHIIVKQHNADELHTLIKNNYVSKTVKNSENVTVFRLAYDQFVPFAQNTTKVDIYKEEAIKTRCCYFMLQKYFAENDFDKHENCCSKHLVTKKYKFDFLKQSPSASLSPSASISVSSSSESSISAEKPKILADEPDQDNCCTQLVRYFQKISILE